MPTPMQPTYLDDLQVLRFQENRVVVYLFKHAGISLAHLMMLERVKTPEWAEDIQQFHQLLGIPLSEVSEGERAIALAVRADLVLQEKTLRLQELCKKLHERRKEIKDLVPKFFPRYIGRLDEDNYLAVRQPIQPFVREVNVDRFRRNQVVRYLLDEGTVDMNRLAMRFFEWDEDQAQFAQLIGYSASGFADLDYVSAETYGSAMALLKDPTLQEIDVRLSHVEELFSEASVDLSTLSREELKELMSNLFRVHPDDFETEVSEETN